MFCQYSLVWIMKSMINLQIVKSSFEWRILGVPDRKCYCRLWRYLCENDSQRDSKIVPHQKPRNSWACCWSAIHLLDVQAFPFSIFPFFLEFQRVFYKRIMGLLFDVPSVKSRSIFTFRNRGQRARTITIHRSLNRIAIQHQLDRCVPNCCALRKDHQESTTSQANEFRIYLIHDVVGWLILRAQYYRYFVSVHPPFSASEKKYYQTISYKSMIARPTVFWLIFCKSYLIVCSVVAIRLLVDRFRIIGWFNWLHLRPRRFQFVWQRQTLNICNDVHRVIRQNIAMSRISHVRGIHSNISPHWYSLARVTGTSHRTADFLTSGQWDEWLNAIPTNQLLISNQISKCIASQCYCVHRVCCESDSPTNWIIESIRSHFGRHNRHEIPNQ